MTIQIIFQENLLADMRTSIRFLVAIIVVHRTLNDWSIFKITCVQLENQNGDYVFTGKVRRIFLKTKVNKFISTLKKKTIE